MIDKLQALKVKDGFWCQLKNGEIICIESKSYQHSKDWVRFYSDTGYEGGMVACFVWEELRGFGDAALIGMIHEGLTEKPVL